MLVWKCDRCGKEYEDTPMIKITKRGGGVQEILLEKQDENEDEQHYVDLCHDCAERFYEWWLEGHQACQDEAAFKIKEVQKIDKWWNGQVKRRIDSND